MKMKINFYCLLFFVFCFCSENSYQEEKSYQLLTNNSVKYWFVKSVNGVNIDRPRSIWMFNVSKEYKTYYYKNEYTFVEDDNGDEIYENVFKIDNDSLVLNLHYKNKIILLESSKLILKSETGEKLLLLPINPPDGASMSK